MKINCSTCALYILGNFFTLRLDINNVEQANLRFYGHSSACQEVFHTVFKVPNITMAPSQVIFKSLNKNILFCKVLY